LVEAASKDHRAQASRTPQPSVGGSDSLSSLPLCSVSRTSGGGAFGNRMLRSRRSGIDVDSRKKEPRGKLDAGSRPLRRVLRTGSGSHLRWRGSVASDAGRVGSADRKPRSEMTAETLQSIRAAEQDRQAALEDRIYCCTVAGCESS